MFVDLSYHLGSNLLKASRHALSPCGHCSIRRPTFSASTNEFAFISSKFGPQIDEWVFSSLQRVNIQILGVVLTMRSAKSSEATQLFSQRDTVD